MNRVDSGLATRREWATVLAWAAVLLAFARLVLQPQMLAVAPEECHTGGIAVDLLEHGMRWPFFSYTPEHYENGIVLQGFLAVPFFVAFGRNVLALKLLTIVVAFLVVVLGFALLLRVLAATGLTRGPRRTAAIGCYLALMVFAPPLIVREGTDALGDENEATAMALVILVLLARRIERPSLARVAGLFGLAGFLGFWHEGTLLATAVAAAHELVSVLRRRSPAGWLFAAAAAFMVGHTPAFVAHVASQNRDITTILAKFAPSSLVTPLLTFAPLSWASFDGNPILLAAMIAAVVFCVRTAKTATRAEDLLPWLALYVCGHVALMVLAMAHGHLDYWYYGYPVLAGVASVRAVSAATWVGERLGGSATVRNAALAAGPLVLAAGSLRHARPDFGKIASMHADRDRAVCTWRFGRAFLHARNYDRERAADDCRTLGADAGLECLSGLAFEGAPVELGRGDAERLALAFGKGRRVARERDGAHACERLIDRREREACETGGRYECLFYSHVVSDWLLLDVDHPMPRPRCELTVPSFAGHARGMKAEWSQLPEGSVEPGALIPLGLDPHACVEQLEACYPGRLAQNPAWWRALAGNP